MDELLNKSIELSKMVQSMGSKGEDTTDLLNIITQLQSAVNKKRKSAQAHSGEGTSSSHSETVGAPSQALPVDAPGTFIKEEVADPLCETDELNVEDEKPDLEMSALSPSPPPVRKTRKRKSKKPTKTASATVTAKEEPTVNMGDVEDEDPSRFSDTALTELYEVDDMFDDDIASRTEHLDDDEDDYSSDEDTNEEDGPKRQRKRRNRASIQCKICEVINLIDIANERDPENMAMDLPKYKPSVKYPNQLELSAHIKQHHFEYDESMFEKEKVERRDGGFIYKDGKRLNAERASRYFCLYCPHCKHKYRLHGSVKQIYDQIVFHMHKKHGEALPDESRVYSCELCTFQTLRRRDMTRHMYVMHTDGVDVKERGIPCDKCGKFVLRTSMEFHMAAIHGVEEVSDQIKARTLRIKCPTCGKMFRGERGLERHIQCVHNKVKEQLCDLCSQTFFAKRDLYLHMFANHKVNMGNLKVFKCPVEGCGYETLARRHLTVHGAVHAETKEFKCESCGKFFKSTPALRQHVRIMHTNDTEYRCPHCSFTSHAKQYVKRHMVIHSDHKRHKCSHPGCTYETHFIENLTKHMKRHGGTSLTKPEPSPQTSLTRAIMASEPIALTPNEDSVGAAVDHATQAVLWGNLVPPIVNPGLPPSSL